MTILTKETDQGIVVLCQGIADLSQAQENLESFRTIHLPENQRCFLDLSGITEVDFSFLQTLISFVKTLGSQGIKLSFLPLPAGHYLGEFFFVMGLDPNLDLVSEEVGL